MDVHDHLVRMLLKQCAPQMRNHERYRIQETGVRMRRRFFVDQVRNGRAEISGDDARHLTRVLRVEAGERYEISDNHNVYLAEIETARKEHVIFRALEKMEAPDLPA